jgi:4-hydroxybenzoate polyprenyltransferase
MNAGADDSAAVSTTAPPASHPFSWLAYAQLVRLPNVFTAMADITMAALAAGALPDRLPGFLLLLLASSCLYCAGMVWNDYFDLEKDKLERPFRPLPMGKVSLRTAALLGAGLMAAGLALAALAGAVGESFRVRPVVLAGLLVVMILLYDSVLKRTPLGPLAMGACRFLNVLLGLSVVAEGTGFWGIWLALVVGLYIVGVTWFARTEAGESDPTQLTAAAGVMLAALVLALALPVLGRPAPRGDFLLVGLGQMLFPYLLVAFAFYLGMPTYRAIQDPLPGNVQAAVKRAVLGLVLLDAILAASLAGTAGLLIALLLVPARYLGRWVYST